MDGNEWFSSLMQVKSFHWDCYRNRHSKISKSCRNWLFCNQWLYSTVILLLITMRKIPLFTCCLILGNISSVLYSNFMTTIHCLDNIHQPREFCFHMLHTSCTTVAHSHIRTKRMQGMQVSNYTLTVMIQQC